MYKEITPAELEAEIARGTALRLIDVREPVEHELARIEQAELLPLSRFNDWATRITPDEEIVVMCHHGVRSAQVCMFFARQGFSNLRNLAGGIDAWSLEVDSDVPRY